MKHASLNVAALAVMASLALVGCKKNEPVNPAPAPAPTAPAPAPAPAPEAVAVQAVTVGTAAAADKSVAAQAVIGARDPIIVSVRTMGTASNVLYAQKLPKELVWQSYPKVLQKHIAPMKII